MNPRACTGRFSPRMSLVKGQVVYVDAHENRQQPTCHKLMSSKRVTVRIAIIGLGPWGLCALERIITKVGLGARHSKQVQVDVIEPATPGTGIYDIAQPD